MVERARSGLLCQGYGGRGYMTVCWGANPGLAKLTGCSNSQVPILLNILGIKLSARIITSSTFVRPGD